MKEDKYGYLRETEHSDLWSRKVAYHKIYQKNRKKYLFPFKEYEVHHIDGNKKNNLVDNLAILLPEEHIDIHQMIDKKIAEGWERKLSCINSWKEFLTEKYPEDVIEFELNREGFEFDPEVPNLLSKENKIRGDIINFYRKTNKKMKKDEIQEILQNPEEFKEIIREYEKKEREELEKIRTERYNLKVKEVEERARQRKKSNKWLFWLILLALGIFSYFKFFR